IRSRRMSLRFFRRWTCNRSEPGECCKAEIAASRSRCSCCKRASCSRNSRSSSLVIATADAWAAATAPGARLCVQTRSGFHLARLAAPDHHLGRGVRRPARGYGADCAGKEPAVVTFPLFVKGGAPYPLEATALHRNPHVITTLLRCTSKPASKTA